MISGLNYVESGNLVISFNLMWLIRTGGLFGTPLVVKIGTIMNYLLMIEKTAGR